MNAPELSFLAEPGEVVDWRLVVLFDAGVESGVLGALPGRVDDLAGRLGLDARGVRIVLDALAAWDVTRAGPDGTYDWGPRRPDDADWPLLYHHARAIRQWSTGLEDRLRGVPVDARPQAMRDAGRWQAAMARGAREQAPGVADAVLAVAPSAGSLLDLGGGHGEYAVEFARRGVKVTLLDRPAMVDVARAGGAVEAAGVELVAGDFFETLPDARFDVVFISGVTHTMPGDRVAELLRRAASVAAPGGLLAVQTFLRARHRTGAIFAVQMLSTGGGGDTHAEDEYRRWVTGAGFAPPEVVDLDEGRRSLLLARAPG